MLKYQNTCLNIVSKLLKQILVDDVNLHDFQGFEVNMRFCTTLKFGAEVGFANLFHWFQIKNDP